MNYMKIKTNCISNGEGIRTAIFVSGCSHKCKGCFNAVSWNPNNGEPYTTETLEFILDSLKYPYVKGLSLLGGEPFEEYNLDDLITLCRMVKDIYNKDNNDEKTKKTIWAYSGYLFEELIKNPKCLELLKECDILVDGKYEEDKHSPMLRFRGSSNQRVIDINQTLEKGEVVLYLE